MGTNGDIRPRGELHAEKNPPAPTRERGVRMGPTWVTARYQDGRLTLSVGGSATYGDDLSAGMTYEAEDTGGAVVKALRAVLESHAERAEADTMEAAYEARALARRRDQEV